MFIIISIYTEKAKEYRHNPLTNEQQQKQRKASQCHSVFNHGYGT